MFGLQQVIDGVGLAGAYALAALGLAVIYRTMRFMQLAHGQLVTLGAYVGWWACAATGSLVAAFVIAAAVMAVFGALLYFSMFRRLLGYSHLSPLMVALGLSLIIQEVLRITVQNGNPVQYARQMGGDVAWDIGGYFVIPSQLGVLVLACVLVLGTAAFVARSRWGIRIRAVAADPAAASLLGIDTDKVFCAVFVYAAMTAGVLGVLLGSTFAYISPTLGNVIGDLGLAAVLAAGMGSVAGVLAVALLIGIAESFVTAAGYSSYIAMVPFVVIILVLLLRPNGLFGAVTQARN
ncbi:MAG TPA: branched-chain amino acid ABC transporter permease [Ramlibacter sp.]|uniref:branched-chain amino acid ABC transporter permease n=1 Tax=Ramlibacter sp. TaxID=1917967 RepID=UPI002B8AC5C3|nr:branched-chain amino acid ABC transporter permease [Ramlibacter sp.]HVZ42874.1 branched-chain amino acid ABC transporter permease [Ramlibacter sp.]